MGKSNQRIVYVDILKGFAILAVVWFHIRFEQCSGKLFSPGIMGSMWHVPLFFLIGGFFINENKLCDTGMFLKTKFKNLYLKGLYYFIPVALLHNFFFDWGWYSIEIDYNGEFVSKLSVVSYGLLLLKQFFLMSREPIVGAMWFLDSLFIAMVGLAILTWCCKKHVLFMREGMKPLYVLMLVILSNVMTNVYGLVLPKINNSITGMGLVYLGSLMYQNGYCQYVNKYSFIVGACVLWNLSLMDDLIGLNNNRYTSVVQLVCVTVSAFYTFSYLAKKIESNLLGKICSYIGEYSFPIMGLHFIGFKICSMFLSLVTANEFGTYYLTTPDLGQNYHYVLIYFTFGVIIPIVIVQNVKFLISIFRHDKRLHGNL